ncbi:Flocculation protein [Yarrowia sp. B02]|nr:Flocculation protein [Yarrowia sp. B02]
MDVLSELCYKAVRLPRQLDQHQRYITLFDNWSTKLMETTKGDIRILVDKMGRTYKMLIFGTQEIDMDVRTLDRDAIPWVILATHVLLDYSTDVTEIMAELFNTFHINGITEDLVRQVIAWSIPAMHIDILQDRDRKSTPSIMALAHKRMDLWRSVFERLQNNEFWRHSDLTSGVVYFALYRLPDGEARGLYTVLFLDGITGALAYSSPFQRDQEGLESMSRYTRRSIDEFLQKHGQPEFMICINPWEDKDKSASLATVLQESITGLPPGATHFCIYMTPADSKGSLPTFLATSLLEVTDRLKEDFKRLKGDSTLAFYASRGTQAAWECVFMTSFAERLQRKFSTFQPRGYFDGCNEVDPDLCQLKYVVPSKEVAVSLMGPKSWGCIYVTPYLDIEADGMGINNDGISQVEDYTQERLDSMLIGSSSYFLHNLSSEAEFKVGMGTQCVRLIKYLETLFRAAPTSKVAGNGAQASRSKELGVLQGPAALMSPPPKQDAASSTKKSGAETRGKPSHVRSGKSAGPQSSTKSTSTRASPVKVSPEKKAEPAKRTPEKPVLKTAVGASPAPSRRPTPKQPTSAKPTPAKPTPAKPTPAKPTPAKSTPAKSTLVQASTSQASSSNTTATNPSPKTRRPASAAATSKSAPKKAPLSQDSPKSSVDKPTSDKSASTRKSATVAKTASSPNTATAEKLTAKASPSTRPITRPVADAPISKHGTTASQSDPPATPVVDEAPEQNVPTKPSVQVGSQVQTPSTGTTPSARKRVTPETPAGDKSRDPVQKKPKVESSKTPVDSAKKTALETPVAGPSSAKSPAESTTESSGKRSIDQVSTGEKSAVESAKQSPDLVEGIDHANGEKKARKDSEDNDKPESPRVSAYRSFTNRLSQLFQSNT